MDNPEAGNDDTLASRLAEEAGHRLVALREEMGFDDARALKDRGDRVSHDYLVEALREARPDDAILSEEDLELRAEQRSPRVWIIDPLDGTREFSEAGRADWAVHVALVVDGQPVAGAVALPARGLTLTAAEPPDLAEPADPPRLLVSRTRRPEPILELARRLGAELVELGSAGAKTAAVVLGDAEVYAHTGGQYEWDSAAPVAVARAAGLHTSRLDGSEIVYDRPDPWLPDLLVCRPELADRALEALADITASTD